MKRIRRWTVWAVILCLFCSLWAPTAVSAAQQEKSTPVDPMYAAGELLEKLDNGAALRYFYDRIIDGILAQEEVYIYLPFDTYSLTASEALLVEAAVNAAIPEGFGVDRGHSYGWLNVYEDGVVFASWFYDWELTQSMEEQVNAVVDEMTADLAGKSDFDKCRILYERLVDLNTYDMGVYHQTAYGALIEETSVCAGYARAYQLLLYEMGIPCLYIHGVADNGWEVGAHAWNLVRLDGKWYYADPTWDDPDGFYALNYAYFNITYDEISVDHMADASIEPWLPKTVAIDANYYYHEGFVCDSLTVQEMADLFLQKNPLPLYVTGDPQAVADFFFHHLYEITDAMGLYSFGYVTYWTVGSHGLLLSIEYNHVHEDTTADGYCDYCHGPIRPSATSGDVDGNGTVNNRDLGLLQQYINEWAVTLDTTAADINADGHINNRDLGTLQRLINA